MSDSSLAAARHAAPLPVTNGAKATPRRPVVIGAEPLQSPKWLLGFVYVEMACQIILLFPSVAGLRVVVRSAAFATSVLLVLFLPGPRESHPARRVGILALVIVGLSLLNPSTNTMVAGLATVAINLGIMGPIFWVPRIRIDLATVRRLFFVFWLFHAFSAALGVLQTYYPGQFQPATASSLDETYVQSLKITLANGTRVLRPMGLTDTPGGAGIGGVYSVLLASAFLLDRPRFWFRMALFASIAVGCFTLYLCQVRSLVVMLAISLLAMTVPFIMQRRLGRLASVAIPVGLIATVAFIVAIATGGDAMMDRLSSLFESDPGNVYYSNRGFFLEHTVNELLPQFPLGAGLGRWGTIFTYFGDHFNPVSPSIWVEIQWTGWLLDGGIPLIFLYSGALILTVVQAFRMSTRQRYAGDVELNKWSAMLAGYCVSVIALTFGSCPFGGTLGLDFWLLNAALFAVSCQLGNPELSR